MINEIIENLFNQVTDKDLSMICVIIDHESEEVITSIHSDDASLTEMIVNFIKEHPDTKDCFYKALMIIQDEVVRLN
jgi:hypothetical protein